MAISMSLDLSEAVENASQLGHLARSRQMAWLHVESSGERSHTSRRRRRRSGLESSQSDRMQAGPSCQLSLRKKALNAELSEVLGEHHGFSIHLRLATC
jgi:hypothetical protein